jgi:hypothetical protein
VPALAAAALLALAALAPPAAGQPDLCRRWREAFASMPVRMIVLETGQKRLGVRVKLAETPEQHAAGFQCATPQEVERNLILFDFGQEIHTQFHMQNVPVALDIAFMKADGRLFAILRMDPSPTALYGPLGPFRWALEARKGFFESQGLRQGEVRLVPPPGP